MTPMSEVLEAECDRLRELVHHLRHCRWCGETDVMECIEGKQLWEAAGLPADGSASPQTPTQEGQ